MRSSRLPIALLVAAVAASPACSRREEPAPAPPAPAAVAPVEAAPAPTAPPETPAPAAAPVSATSSAAPAAPAPAAPAEAPAKPKAAPAPTAAPKATAPAPPPTAVPAPPATAAPAPPPTAAPKAPPAPAASASNVVDPGGEVVVAATKPGLARVGADKCRVCHKVQHASWAASGHAKRTPPLDCEGCHGPGSEYKAMSVMKDPKKARAAGLVDPDAAFCGKCHKGTVDAAFLAKAHAHKGS